jgi:hypothetical protein
VSQEKSQSPEEEKLILQSMLDVTRTRLAQAVLLNADLEALLTLERKKSAELLEMLSGKNTNNSVTKHD